MKSRSYTHGGPTKGTRFAILARVSTLGQFAHGGSIEAQVKLLNAAVARLKGIVVNAERYVGQEHGTQGYERKLLQRLLDDAALGLFDAVMVPDFDRWSRGNKLAESGLDLFIQHGIRFFVGDSEHDLEDEDTRLMLGVQSHLNKAVAQKLVKKGHMTRILRALRGWPSSGNKTEESEGSSSLPYGRTLLNPRDRQNGVARWGLDEKKAAELRKVAKDYLKPGVTWYDIAKKFGGTSTGWQRRVYGKKDGLLVKVASDQLVVPYKRLSIKPSMFAVNGRYPANLRVEGDTLFVTISVPRILADDVIDAIIQKSSSQRVALTKLPAKVQPLRGYLKCAVCGSNLNVHHDRQHGRSYVAHADKTLTPDCPRRFGRFEPLYGAVFDSLSDLFTNSEALDAAIKDAVRGQQSAKPEAAQRRDEVAKAMRAVQAKIDKLAVQLENDMPESLRKTVMANAAKYEEQLGELRAEDAKLQAELRVIELPPNLHEMTAFAKKVVPWKFGRKQMWPTEAKLQMLHFLFGVPHRKPLPSTGEDPLGQPGVYLKQSEDGTVSWEARGTFGVLSEARGGVRMDPERVAAFFAEFPFHRVPHPANPSWPRRNRVIDKTAYTRARWCAARWR